MEQKLRWYDTITLNIYYLGLTTLSQTIAPLVLPLLIQQFVGEGQKGTYLGIIRLWGLMVALLAQALMGMLSDRSMLRWGRRRPFIAAGTLLDLIFIAAIAFSTTLEGHTGFWFLFAMYLLLQITSNTAHSAVQGLIPDLVPDEKRGLYSGVKALLEVPLPVILVSFTIGNLIKNGNMIGGIATMSGILVTTMLLTMFVKEKPRTDPPPPLDWKPFLRLALMTAAFTVAILGMGELVKLAGRALMNSNSPALQAVGMGAVGLLAMGFAIAAGVWVSVRICIGAECADRNPSFTWWVINRLAFLVGTTNLATFALYFIQARLSLPQTEAAGPATQLMMFVGVAILLSALPSGWLTDKFGLKRMVAASGLLAGAGTLILLLAPSLPPIFVGGGIIGLATGAFYTANWALGTSLVPQDEAGRYLGISNLAGAGAGAVGAYISGPIADYFTVHVPQAPGMGYILIFALYGLLFLLSTVTLLNVKVSEAQ